MWAWWGDHSHPQLIPEPRGKAWLSVTSCWEPSPAWGNVLFPQSPLCLPPARASFFTPSAFRLCKGDSDHTQLIELLGGCKVTHLLSAPNSFWHVVGALGMLAMLMLLVVLIWSLFWEFLFLTFVHLKCFRISILVLLTKGSLASHSGSMLSTGRYGREMGVPPTSGPLHACVPLPSRLSSHPPLSWVDPLPSAGLLPSAHKHAQCSLSTKDGAGLGQSPHINPALKAVLIKPSPTGKPACCLVPVPSPSASSHLALPAMAPKREGQASAVHGLMSLSPSIHSCPCLSLPPLP